MDDCSGNVFGKILIRKYYSIKCQGTSCRIRKEYNVDPDYIKSKLYKEDNPNAYLATFAKFLIQHKDTEFCKKIILKDEVFVKTISDNMIIVKKYHIL
jgi:endo-1,4-beta-mannosidase